MREGLVPETSVSTYASVQAPARALPSGTAACEPSGPSDSASEHRSEWPRLLARGFLISIGTAAASLLFSSMGTAHAGDGTPDEVGVVEQAGVEETDADADVSGSSPQDEVSTEAMAQATEEAVESPTESRAVPEATPDESSNTLGEIVEPVTNAVEEPVSELIDEPVSGVTNEVLSTDHHTPAADAPANPDETPDNHNHTEAPAESDIDIDNGSGTPDEVGVVEQAGVEETDADADVSGSSPQDEVSTEAMAQATEEAVESPTESRAVPEATPDESSNTLGEIVAPVTNLVDPVTNLVNERVEDLIGQPASGVANEVLGTDQETPRLLGISADSDGEGITRHGSPLNGSSQHLDNETHVAARDTGIGELADGAEVEPLSAVVGTVDSVVGALGMDDTLPALQPVTDTLVSTTASNDATAPAAPSASSTDVEVLALLPDLGAGDLVDGAQLGPLSGALSPVLATVDSVVGTLGVDDALPALQPVTDTVLSTTASADTATTDPLGGVLSPIVGTVNDVVGTLGVEDALPALQPVAGSGSLLPDVDPVVESLTATTGNVAPTTDIDGLLENLLAVTDPSSPIEAADVLGTKSYTPDVGEAIPIASVDGSTPHRATIGQDLAAVVIDRGHNAIAPRAERSLIDSTTAAATRATTPQVDARPHRAMTGRASHDIGTSSADMSAEATQPSSQPTNSGPDDSGHTSSGEGAESGGSGGLVRTHPAGARALAVIAGPGAVANCGSSSGNAHAFSTAAACLPASRSNAGPDAVLVRAEDSRGYTGPVDRPGFSPD